jgi:hypothetical protein
MTSIVQMRERLEDAAGLSGVLGVAYDAFEYMRLAIRAHDDPGSGLVAAFMMAAASAADGREAIGFAPSLPRYPSERALEQDAAPAVESAESTAEAVADLSRVLVTRLATAGGSATDPGDWAACADAARCAQNVYGLLHLSGP